MNRKLALRLLLDAVMLTVMVILMGPGVTGIPWHEIIGTAVLVLFIVHCAVNAWWFRAAAKRRQGRRTFYSVLRQTVNFLLLADSVLLLVSSLMISHSVFAFLGLSGGTVWVYLHRVSAYTELILISVHLGLHWKMILAAMRQALHVQSTNKVLTMSWRICSLVLAVFGIWASITRDIAGKYRLPESSADVTQSGETDSTTVTAKSKQQTVLYQKMNVRKGETVERSFSDTPIQSGESEENFLGRLTCTGCGKHCPLTSPQCGTGTSQAQQASAYYQSQNGETVSSSESSSQEEKDSSTVSTPTAENGTLEEYLGSLACTGCGRHCPLTSPQCSVGQQQAQEATTAYQSKYATSADEREKQPMEEADSLPLLFRDYIPIMGMYAAGTYYLLEFVQIRERKKKELNKLSK